MPRALLYLECTLCINKAILLAKTGPEPSWDFGWKEQENGILQGLYGEAFTERLNRFAKDHLHDSDWPTHFRLIYRPPH